MRGVVAVIVASVLLLDGCGCTAIGCPTVAVTIEVDVTATPAQLDGGLFRLCRNAVCNEYGIAIAGTKPILATIRRDELHVSHVGLAIDPHTILQIPNYLEEDLADGDVYTLELRDAAGAVVQSWRWEADYRERYPNGENCHDVPCRQVDLSSANAASQSP